MFTGIVQAWGRIEAVNRNPFGVRLVIDRGSWQPPGYEPAPGDSISVSGVCLTVMEATGQTLGFDVIAETLDKTTLGELTPGSEVNLDPAVLANQPLGGHFVQGHVDGVGRVTQVYSGSDEWRVTVEPPAELAPYIVPKGSVAIDGVSLTVAAVSDGAGGGAVDFQVALIPTTLERTTLGRVNEGQRVNLETDIISKTIVHYLRHLGSDEKPTVTIEALRHAGFVT